MHTDLSVIHSETEPLRSVCLYTEPGWRVSSCPSAECSGRWRSQSEEWTWGPALDSGTMSGCSTVLEDLQKHRQTQTHCMTHRDDGQCRLKIWPWVQSSELFISTQMLVNYNPTTENIITLIIWLHWLQVQSATNSISAFFVTRDLKPPLWLNVSCHPPGGASSNCTEGIQ